MQLDATSASPISSSLSGRAPATPALITASNPSLKRRMASTVAAAALVRPTPQTITLASLTAPIARASASTDVTMSKRIRQANSKVQRIKVQRRAVIAGLYMDFDPLILLTFPLFQFANPDIPIPYRVAVILEQNRSAGDHLTIEAPRSCVRQRQ